jgi:hypothetical protein
LGLALASIPIAADGTRRQTRVSPQIRAII